MMDRFLAIRRGQARRQGVPVVFLASERASDVTGCTIPVDGGFPRGLR